MVLFRHESRVLLISSIGISGVVKQILDFGREISLTLDCDLIVHQRYCIREIIPQDFFSHKLESVYRRGYCRLLCKDSSKFQQCLKMCMTGVD